MPKDRNAPLDPLTNPGCPMELRFGPLHLVAFSVSAIATYVLAPTLDAVFDLGHCPVEAAALKHAFLSHVHQDHALGTYRLFSLRSLQGRAPPRVFLPAESRGAMVKALAALQALEEREEHDFEKSVVGVRPGEEVSIGRDRRVRVFDVKHRVASRGFTVLETRRKLREPYRGLRGDAIAAAVARGEEVHDKHEAAAFTYVGDSTIATLEAHPELGQSEVLFLEATHLPGTSPEISAKWGHTHLEELVELYRKSPATLASKHIVLKHFSQRYSRGEIERSAAVLPPELRERVTLLLAPRR